MTKQNMLALRAVSAGYRRQTVLHEVSTELKTGQWLAIIGPNGAGKSTLLKSVAGLVDYSGEILLGDQRIDSYGHRARAQLVGYAPQLPLLPDGLTVTDYALLGRTPYLGPLAKEGRADVELVAEELDRLDLSELADRKLSTLSGGEQRRAVLARVFAQRANLLLLDEPTTGLDIGHAQSLLELVDQQRKEAGTTVVSTLHDLTVAAQYADRLMLVNRGRVVAEGDPAEVLTAERLSQEYTARVDVLDTPDGGRVVAPVRAPRSGT